MPTSVHNILINDKKNNIFFIITNLAIVGKHSRIVQQTDQKVSRRLITKMQYREKKGKERNKRCFLSLLISTFQAKVNYCRKNLNPCP